jgi:Flp pilus assembly protein TadG
MKELLQSFRRDQRGVAAIELAVFGTIFVFGAMNTVEIGRYAYQTSEVNAAAQAGAEAAIVACDLTHVPATLNCPALNVAITTAIQTTPLGANITLDAPTSEGWYCLDTTGALKLASAAGAQPSDCSWISNPAPGATPALYLQVHVTYTFQSLFPGVTLAQTFAPSIKRTAWMRMS